MNDFESLETYAYLQAKAERFLEIGPESYRAEDAFGMPRDDMGADMLACVQLGMEQLVAGHGLTRERPFWGLGIGGFYALLATLHFQLEEQTIARMEPEMVLDEMRMVHVMDGRRVTLYNLVAKPALL